MGRPRKPTTLKVIDGENRRERLNPNEPKPKPLAPKCPVHLKGIARKLWNQLAPEMERIKLLTNVDGTAFESLCVAYARYREAEEEIKKDGLIINTTNGNVIQNPAVGVSNTALKLVLQCVKEFGMTPASRAGISIPIDPGEEDPMEKHLKQQGL